MVRRNARRRVVDSARRAAAPVAPIGRAARDGAAPAVGPLASRGGSATFAPVITLAGTVAALLYLLPVAVVWVACSRRDAEPWEYALAVPFAVAVDLLGILLLARFLRLEQAAVVSRAGWALAALALAVAVAARRRPRPALPAWLSLRDVVAVATAGGLALLLSLDISRPCSIWDRIWHTPLVASIRGQAIPFTNVYGDGLRYHFSGNALAAVLQTLSGGVLHASLALSVAHDVLFGLLGVSLALWFRSCGVKGAAPIAAALLAVLLGGPGTLLVTGRSRPDAGHSILSFMQISFRPHASLAALLFVGFVGAVLVSRPAGVRGRPGAAHAGRPPRLRRAPRRDGRGVARPARPGARAHLDRRARGHPSPARRRRRGLRGAPGGADRAESGAGRRARRPGGRGTTSPSSPGARRATRRRPPR